MDINRNIKRSAFYTPAGSHNTNIKVDDDRVSPTSTHEFPATPTTSNRTVNNGSFIKNNSDDSKKLPPTTAAAAAFATAPSRAVGLVPMNFYGSSSEGNEGGKEGAAWNTMKDTPSAATANNVAAARVPKPVASATDEKARARQARMVAMAQQQQQQMHKAKTTAWNSPGNSPVVGPPRRDSLHEDPDVIAKRQGRASSISEGTVRKLEPPLRMTALTSRTTTMSSISTTSSGSTEVTHNNSSWAPPTFSSAASMARNMAVSLVLEDDDDLDDATSTSQCAVNKRRSTDAADLEVKKRAARPAQKAIPRRFTTIGLVDADAAVKHNARMTPEEMMLRGAVARRSYSSTTSAGNTIADSIMSSQHSNASSVSSVGAHSVTGGRRVAKKSDSNTDVDDDAVGHYLTSLAASQVAAAGLQFVPEDEDDHFDVEEVKKPGAMAMGKGSMDAGASKHAKLGRISNRGSQKESFLSHIGMDKDENHGTDDEEFANAGSGDELEEEEEEMQVAQAGVPVLQLQPGAFAVEGMNGHGSNSDFNEPFDSDLNRDDDWDRDASGVFSHRSHDPTLTDPNSALFFDQELALEATLYNNEADSGDIHGELHVVFDAQPLSEEPATMSAKAIRRLRMMQGGIFCLALGAIAAVVAVAVSRPDQAASLAPWHQIPVIQGWNQVGTNLTGPTDDDKSLFGYAIAMAGNAERIAIGVPGRDQGVTALLVGEVHILDWNGTDWFPSGLPIVGPGPDGQAGTAVAMSKNGKRVAVGSPFLAGQGGHVAVYEENVSSTKWVIVGQVLVGNVSNIGSGDGRFGSSLALSDDGSTLAVGATMGENIQGGSDDSGYVKIYHLQHVGASRWVPIGDTIFGENQGDFFGWSLAMSASGTRIAAGAVGSTGGGVGELSGQVRVFDYVDEDDTWTQAGSSISGLAAFDSFGSSVAMSSKGNIIAVGAIGHSNTDQGVDIGHVRVFHYVDSDTEPTWEPLGQILTGQSAFDSFGYSVSLSEDGKVVAAGGPRNDEFSESSGHIQVFELTAEGNADAWVRRGSNIGGSYDSPDLFGWSIALSSNGTHVAGGAPFSTFDGRLNDVGTVRIYDVA
jgi:hypothetical protein